MSNTDFITLLTVFTKEELNEYIRKNGKKRKSTNVLIYLNK